MRGHDYACSECGNDITGAIEFMRDVNEDRHYRADVGWDLGYSVYCRNCTHVNHFMPQDDPLKRLEPWDFTQERDTVSDIYCKDRFLKCCGTMISAGPVGYEDQHSLDEILDAKQAEHDKHCIPGINTNAVHFKAGGEDEQ